MSPDSWKQIRLTVIFNNNNPELVSNYRPIATIPILYKLFSRMLCNRIQGQTFKNLSPDQAAYRPGLSVDDHLLTVTLLVERCKEFNQDLFIGLVDSEKAFDTIEHPMLWKAIREVGVDDCYIEILQKLYNGQVAAVTAGAVSREFSLLRGVKQGDPISGLLFMQ